MKPTKVMMTQAVVNTDELLKWFKKETNLDPEGMGWKIAAHHMTIEFFKKGKALDLVPIIDMIGTIVFLDVVGYTFDDKAMVLLVEPRQPLANHVHKAHPHITIATAPGVPAKYSNELLASQEVTPLKGSISSIVGWKNSSGNVDEFDLPWELQ